MGEITTLKRFRTYLKKRKIPYQAMTSYDRNGCEGFNDGLSLGIKWLDNKIKKLEAFYNSRKEGDPKFKK